MPSQRRIFTFSTSGLTTLCVVTRPHPAEVGGREALAQLGLLGAPPLWISDVGEAPSW